LAPIGPTDSLSVNNAFLREAKENLFELKEKTKETKDSLKAKIKEVGVIGGTKELYNKGKDALSAARNITTDTVKDFYEDHKDKVSDTLDNVKEKAEPIVAGAKGATKEMMEKISNNSLGSLASGAIMGSAQIARTAFMKPLRFMNFLGRKIGDRPMPNMGNMASGMSVNEALPILLNYNLTQKLQGINSSVDRLVKETRNRFKEPEAGSSEDIRRKRKEKKDQKEINAKEAVKGGGLAAIGGLIGKLFGKGEDGEDGGVSGWGAAAAGGAGALFSKLLGKGINAGKKGIGKLASGAGSVAKKGLGLALKATPIGKISRLGERLLSSGKGAAALTASTALAKTNLSMWGKAKLFGKFSLGGLLATSLLDSAAAANEGTITGDVLDAASTAVSIGSVIAMFGGTSALASAASLIGSAAVAVGSILLSPGVLTAAAVGGTGYGIYRYFTRVEFDDVNRVRLAQYGFDTSDRSLLAKICDLEKLVSEKALSFKDNGVASVNIKLNYDDVADALDIDKKDNALKERTTLWLVKRFIPIYAMHVSVIRKIKNKVDTRAIEDFKDVELLAYLKATRYKEGPYDQMTSPFSAEVDLNADADTVEVLYQRALIKLKKKVGNDKETIERKEKLKALIGLPGLDDDKDKSKGVDVKDGEEKEKYEETDLRDQPLDKLLDKESGGVSLVVKSDIGNDFEETDLKISAINALRYRI